MWRRRCDQRPVGPCRRRGDRLRADGRGRTRRRFLAGGLPRRGSRLLHPQVRGPGRRDRPAGAPGPHDGPGRQGRHDRASTTCARRSPRRTRSATWTRSPSACEALVGEIDSRREERKAARAKAQEEARTAKEALVAEAEQLAESTQWREAGDRLRALVDTWKGLPRLDRKSDDELWHRFSHARSAFSKHRKAHFAALDAARRGPRR